MHQAPLLPDEVARTALFLAADDSRMITKQCLRRRRGLALRPLTPMNAPIRSAAQRSRKVCIT